MGHSSGAQIAMLAALQGRLVGKVDALIGMSGVYDLEIARKRELEQGLVHLSPMGPACKGMLKKFSPSHVVENDSRDNTNDDGDDKEEGSSLLSSLPPILLLHGADDEVAPPAYSIKFHNIMETQEQKEPLGTICNLHILENLGHEDTVLATCIGGSCQSTIFEWIDQVWDDRDR
jgi:acetyl esterase/lipase